MAGVGGGFEFCVDDVVVGSVGRKGLRGVLTMCVEVVMFGLGLIVKG